MNFKKIVFATAFFAVFSGAFVVNAQSVQAATVEELKTLIAQLQVQIAQLQEQLAESQGQPATFCYDFNTNLGFAQSGTAAVKALHTALQKQGFSVGSDITAGAFTENTASAVVGFQQKYKEDVLAPYGLQFGTGFVGPTTRAKLNALYGCGVAQPAPTPSPVPTPTPTPTPTPQPVSPAFILLSPNGGEELFQGVSYSIVWQPGDSFERVSIYLDEADVTLASDVIADNIPNTGSYTWTVGATQKSSYTIRICEYRDPAASYYAVTCDASDSYFNIAAVPTLSAPEMMYPANGQVLNYGHPHGYMFKVKPVAGASGYLFGFFQNGVMVYENWRDNKTLSKNGEFAIWPSNPFYSKIQEGDLQVWVRTWINNQWSEARIITIKLVLPSTSKPSISVTYPNGGETLQKGSNTYVNLKFSPSVPIGGFVVNLIRSDTDVAVAHLKFCGTANDYIQDNVVPPNLSWPWKVGYDADGKEIPNGSYRIFVYDCGAKTDSVWKGSTASAKSGIFSIVSATPSITVTSPNGGEKWQVGSVQFIQWSGGSSQLYSSVDAYVETFTNGQFSVAGKVIISGFGSIQWDTGEVDEIGKFVKPGEYYIRLVDKETGAQDRSDSSFTILAKGTIQADLKVNGQDGDVSLDTVPDQDPLSVLLSWTSVSAERCTIFYQNSNYKSSGFVNANGKLVNADYLAFLPTAGDIDLIIPEPSAANHDVSVACSSDMGSATDTIKLMKSSSPSITVLSPNGGETWTMDNTYTVSWNHTAAGDFDEAWVDLLKGGKYYGPLAGDAVRLDPHSTTSVSWKVGQMKGGVSEGDDYQIRVTYNDGDSPGGKQISDTSNGYFSIVEATTATPSITVLSPNGGEEWVASGAYSVKWTSQNIPSTASVVIEFQKGGVVTNPVKQYVEPNDGSLDIEALDLSVGDDYKVNIYYGEAAEDFSDGYFSIVSATSTAPSISLTAPLKDARLTAGSSYTVKWDARWLEMGYDIFVYHRMPEGDWTLDAKLGYNATAYTWTAPQMKQNEYDVLLWVGVKDEEGKWAAKDSHYVMVLPAAEEQESSITVLSPNGGEEWTAGQTYNITWSSDNLGDAAIVISLINYSYSSELAYPIAPLTSNDGSYSWTVPADIQSMHSGWNSGDSFRVFVAELKQDGSYGAQDESDNYFSIVSATTVTPSITVTSPNGGEEWREGETRTITWTRSGVPGGSYQEHVNLYKGGTPWGNIAIRDIRASDVTVKQEYAWEVGRMRSQTVPVTPGSDYTIEIVLYKSFDVVASDKSDAPFSIKGKPSITVFSPKSGEEWVQGSTYFVGVTCQQPETINIWLTHKDAEGGTVSQIASQVGCTDSSYSWTIPAFDLPTDTSAFKVYAVTTDGLVSGESTAFSIVSATTATPSISSFNYTETDAYGGSIRFYWTNSGTDFVNLWIPCYSGLTIKNAVTGANFLCGESDLQLSSNSSIYLKFTNTSGALINAIATLTPIAGNITYGTSSKTINFTIVAGDLGLEDVENQLASISNAAENLLAEIKKLLEK